MKAILLTEKDTVATVIGETAKGEEIVLTISGNEIGRIHASEPIPFGFKICAKAMKKGDPVVKYGHVIGRASKDIFAGDLVHIHNIEGNRGRGDLAKAKGEAR